MPLIDVAGTPRERGLQYGRGAGERIARSIQIYRPAFEDAGLTFGRVEEIAQRFLERLRERDPRLAEEIVGIAEGSEQPVEEIMALNARTELLHGRASLPEEQDLDGGCTGAIALPGITADGHVLHGQNWDWIDACRDSVVVIRVEPDRGPRMLLFVEAGIVGRCGLNGAGIGLTGNFLKCDGDSVAAGKGEPIPFVRRRILESETLYHASREVFHAARSFSTNLMISHAGGEAMNLEATPAEVFWVPPQEGLLVHANHFLSPAALAKVKDVGVESHPDSLYRDRRVRERLSASRPRLTREDFQQALADDYGRPYAVCHSPVARRNGSIYSTVATIIMDLTEKKMWVAPAPYAGASYSEYALD